MSSPSDSEVPLSGLARVAAELVKRADHPVLHADFPNGIRVTIKPRTMAELRAILAAAEAQP